MATVTLGREKPYLFHTITKKQALVVIFCPSKAWSKGCFMVYCLGEGGECPGVGTRSYLCPPLPAPRSTRTQGSPLYLELLFLDVFSAGAVGDSGSQLLLIRTFFPSCGDFAWILDPGDFQLPGSGFHCRFCQDFTFRWHSKGFSFFLLWIFYVT